MKGKSQMEVRDVELDKIDQNENSRVIYKDADLAELMDSMKRHGLQQPVGVRKDGARWDAVFGNRRIVAAKKLGWHTIPAHVIDIADDQERDILNLVENIKRTNTTLSEDGRLFQKLIERGLSKKEVAARIGITERRIELALEVFNDIPKEYHKRILNVGQGTTGTGKPGHISAKTANEIMNLRRDFQLNRAQTRKLMDEAMHNRDVNADTIRIAVPAMKEGATLDQALHLMKDFDTVVLRVFFSKKEADKIEKREQKTITQILLDWLEDFPEISISRRVTTDPRLRRKKPAPVGMAVQSRKREEKKGVRA